MALLARTMASKLSAVHTELLVLGSDLFFLSEAQGLQVCANIISRLLSFTWHTGHWDVHCRGARYFEVA
jgi:hypothetical protein